MKLISVNIGLPKVTAYEGRTVRTGIFKAPVARRVKVSRRNIDGDGQADARVHGGVNKAVYAYPSEHYSYWEERLGVNLEWGAFGENLTTLGLSESEVSIGDCYRFGTALLKVTEPRQPCYKLAMKLERNDIIELFRQSGRSGFYLSVIEEGELASNDPIQPVSKSDHRISISDLNRLELEPENKDLLHQVLASPNLSPSQRRHFEKRI